MNNKIPDHMHILHLGKCSICGRPLEDAISLERGIGPICYRQVEDFNTALNLLKFTFSNKTTQTT